MKKFVVMAMAVSMLSTSVLMPKRSEAALGLLSGNLPLLVTGAVFATVDTPVFETCAGTPWGRTCRVAWYTGFLGAFGLLLLDGSQNQTVAFDALTAPQAAQLGITAVQLDAYNHELAEINAIRETIQGDVLGQVQKGNTVLESQIHTMWTSYQSMLSPEAYAALVKVSAQAAPALK
jgi:hypothetical protein